MMRVCGSGFGHTPATPYISRAASTGAQRVISTIGRQKICGVRFYSQTSGSFWKERIWYRPLKNMSQEAWVNMVRRYQECIFRCCETNDFGESSDFLYEFRQKLEQRREGGGSPYLQLKEIGSKDEQETFETALHSLAKGAWECGHPRLAINHLEFLWELRKDRADEDLLLLGHRLVICYLFSAHDKREQAEGLSDELLVMAEKMKPERWIHSILFAERGTLHLMRAVEAEDASSFYKSVRKARYYYQTAVRYHDDEVLFYSQMRETIDLLRFGVDYSNFQSHLSFKLDSGLWFDLPGCLLETVEANVNQKIPIWVAGGAISLFYGWVVPGLQGGYSSITVERLANKQLLMELVRLREKYAYLRSATIGSS